MKISAVWKRLQYRGIEPERRGSRAMAKTVKLADIGEKLGVSAVTVSKALSGQKGVSEEMREKIVSLADEMGYVRNVARMSRRENKSYTIGVIVSDQYFDRGQSFYSKLYQEVAKAAQAAGSVAVLELISYEQDQRNFIPQLAYEGKVDGVIILGDFPRMYEHYLEDHLELPLIYLDSNGKFDVQDCVVSNNMLGGYEMTNYLLNLGHSRIGFVGTRLVTASIDDRFLGYYKALMERGIPLREDWILKDREWNRNVRVYEKDFQLPEDMPTAFFANCDLTADVLYHKLTEQGYRVPEDISIVGFDHYLDTDFAAQLTTYEISQSRMAREAVHMILRKIRDPKLEPGTLVIPGKFIEKTSARRIGASVKRL